MAKGETIGSLSISLGIDLSQLQPDLLTAEDTVAKAMGKLTQKAAQTKLRTEIEIANLDGVGSEIDKAKAKEKELIQLLDIENQKLKIRQANYQANVKNYGADSGVTRSSLTSMLSQERQVASLNAELRNLRKNLSTPPASNGIVGSLNEVSNAISSTQGKVTDFNSRLTNALSGSTGMVQELGGILSSLPGKAGLAGAAVAAVGAATVGATSQLTDFIKSATASGDALYRASIKFGISTKELKELQNLSKFGSGTDVETVIQSLTRLDKALLSAGASGNSASRMLTQFGVTLQNGNGELLNYREQLYRIADGYKAAKDAGQGAEYLIQIFGTRGANEMRAYLEMLDEAKASMSQVKGFIKPIDPEEAHKAQIAIAVMDEQWNKLKGSAANALLPIAMEYLPKITRLAEITALSVGKIIEGFDYLSKINPLSKIRDEIFSSMGKGMDWFGNLLAGEGADEALEEQKTKIDEITSATLRYNDVAVDSAQTITNAQKDLLAIQERIESHYGNADEIYYKMSHDATENQIYDIDRWKEAAISKAENAEEVASIVAEAAAKEAEAYEQAAKRAEDANKSIEDKIFEMTHDATENKLHRLQQEIDKYIKDGADASLVETYKRLQSEKILADAQKSARPSFGGGSRGGSDRIGSHIIDIRDGQIMERYGSLFNGYMEAGAKNARDAVGSFEKISDFRPHIFDVQDGQVLESAGNSFRNAMGEAAQYAQYIVDAAQEQNRMLDQYEGTDVSEYTDWSGKNYKIDKDQNGNSMYDGAIMTAMQAKSLIDMREVFAREAESYFQRGNRGGQNFAGQRESQANPVNLTVNNNFSGNVLENEQFMQKISDDAAGRVADEVRKATASATSETSYA